MAQDGISAACDNLLIWPRAHIACEGVAQHLPTVASEQAPRHDRYGPEVEQQHAMGVELECADPRHWKRAEERQLHADQDNLEGFRVRSRPRTVSTPDNAELRQECPDVDG